jgi:mRNA interferase MazF
MAGGIERGDIRLYRFAAPDKERPVVVLTRNISIGLLATVTAAPITATIRGVPSEVVLNQDDGMKSACAVNLHHLATLSQQRLGRRVARLSSARLGEICAAIRFALGCDSDGGPPPMRD